MPQKPGLAPSILSAERAPAADALAAANFSKPHEEAAPKTLTRLADIPASAGNALPDVPALHTYRGDVAATIEEQRISLADIATAGAAQARRETPVRRHWGIWARRHWWQILAIIAGIVFMAAALLALAWTYQNLRSVPSQALPLNAPYLYVDSNKTVAVVPDETRAALMSALTGAEHGDALSVGLVEGLNLEVTSSTGGASASMSAQQFFALVAPQAPDLLVRALNPQFLLGLYSYAGNHPFIMFKTDSYDQAFAGMLSWEYSMQQDLYPLFSAPTPAAAASASSTATSSAASMAATSTPAATSSLQAESQILGTPFRDAIIDNHDVRAATDADGGTIFFWTFVDPQTLVITTDQGTLEEIISRLQNAPTMTIPGR